MYPLIHQCPVCENQLHVTKLQCSHCETTIENQFSLSKFANLSKEQLHFIEVFIISRGNIKEVEKILQVSYPTVRAKLNEVIEKLGYKAETEDGERKKSIIASLESGELTAEEAIQLLKKSKD